MECVWWWLELGVIVSLLGHFQPFGMYNCMEVGSEKEGIWRRKGIPSCLQVVGDSTH